MPVKLIKEWRVKGQGPVAYKIGDRLRCAVSARQVVAAPAVAPVGHRCGHQDADRASGRRELRRYGARKVHAELHRKGHRTARCTVERNIRIAEPWGITRAKGPRTTNLGPGPAARPDLVQRNFTADASDRLWGCDITYCRRFSGCAYAALHEYPI